MEAQTRGAYRREDDEKLRPGADIVELQTRNEGSTGVTQAQPTQITELHMGRAVREESGRLCRRTHPDSHANRAQLARRG